MRGSNAIGRVPISPVAVRYGSSGAKDSKKGKKPKKKDLEWKEDKGMKSWKAKKIERKNNKGEGNEGRKGPATETTSKSVPKGQVPLAGTMAPGAEGLKAAAAEPTTPGETLTALTCLWRNN